MMKTNSFDTKAQFIFTKTQLRYQTIEIKTQNKILLVDDDKTILDILRPGLEQADYKVFTATDGGTAIAEYKRAKPDLCVIDFSLPDMTGIALIESLLAVRYRPMIVLSSHDEQHIVDGATQTGASHYLVKPLSAKQLIPTMRMALNQFKQTQQQLASRYISNENTTVLDEILDQLAFGIIVLDGQLNCINMNQPASAFINKGDILSLTNGKLHTQKPNIRTEFQDFINGLTDHGSSKYKPVFSIEKHVSGQWCHFYGAKLNTNSGSTKHVLLMIIDSSHEQPLTAEILHSLYGLTPKESALAEAINSGIKLEEYAQHNEIKITTVKTHLNAIFRKTGTNRQVDLVRLLSRLIDIVKV